MAAVGQKNRNVIFRILKPDISLAGIMLAYNQLLLFLTGLLLALYTAYYVCTQSLDT